MISRIRSLWPFFGLIWKSPFGRIGRTSSVHALYLGSTSSGVEELEEMPDGEGDDVVVVFEIALVLFESPEDLADIGRDAGLFGDDERLAQRGPLVRLADLMFAFA